MHSNLFSQKYIYMLYIHTAMCACAVRMSLCTCVYIYVLASSRRSSSALSRSVLKEDQTDISVAERALSKSFANVPLPTSSKQLWIMSVIHTTL